MSDTPETRAARIEKLGPAVGDLLDSLVGVIRSAEAEKTRLERERVLRLLRQWYEDDPEPWDVDDLREAIASGRTTLEGE